MHDSGKPILRALFVLVWIIALVHIAAEHYAWYWMFRWLDIPMHILGGMWLALAVLWLRDHTGYVRRVCALLPNGTITTALIGGLMLGLAWEFYEFCIWQYIGFGFPQHYAADTALDLINDTLGALSMGIVYRYFTAVRGTQPNV